MSQPLHLAIIGSGASAIYLLKHLLDHAPLLKSRLRAISIFEQSGITGMGMPYNPLTTDRYNMANISSEELPDLTITFADWLRALPASELRDLDLEGVEISDGAIYSRLALGRYLNAQYETLLTRLRQTGIEIHEHADCRITDVQDQPQQQRVLLTTETGSEHLYDQLVIATGHHWTEKDDPASGHYASPWPITKILPEHGQHHLFTIGTLGASLSAFDVVCSLAHRHGRFVRTAEGLTYEPHPGTEAHKIIMHSAHGLLPHLQFAQDEPLRKIYRHVARATMLDLVDAQGFLSLETYFDKICRPVLTEAFTLDHMPAMAQRMADSDFTLQDFVTTMTDKHDYANAFEGMRLEMKEARTSVLQDKPVHWKEAIDDLIYTLNYHAELLPAEDHLILRAEVMPFLLNVVAAMPLPSGETLLALYDAGKLGMVSGKVTLLDPQPEPGATTITVEDGDQQTQTAYRMFIDCSGQKPLEMEDYPFPSLVRDRTVRKARVPFRDASRAIAAMSDAQKAHLFVDANQRYYHIGGVEIDGACRLIGADGTPSARIHDIAFPHTSGMRPYSYGLQACNDTAAIVVQTWVQEIQKHQAVSSDPQELTKIYEKID
ncbi:MAG: FAD/NAD(P)-binding protein [Verrucomicrobiota bacterium]